MSMKGNRRHSTRLLEWRDQPEKMEVGSGTGQGESRDEGRASRAFIGHKMHKRHRRDGGRPREMEARGLKIGGAVNGGKEAPGARKIEVWRRPEGEVEGRKD
jgi:hypothetical protein